MRCILGLAILILFGCSGLMPPQTTKQAEKPPEARPAEPPPAPPKAEAVEKDPLRVKVLAALRKCVDDPDGLEVIAWGEPKPVGQAEEFELRFRARSPGGGKKLHEWTCQMQGGEVVRFWEMDRLGNVRTIDVPR